MSTDDPTTTPTVAPTETPWNDLPKEHPIATWPPVDDSQPWEELPKEHPILELDTVPVVVVSDVPVLAETGTAVDGLLLGSALTFVIAGTLAVALARRSVRRKA